MLNGLPLYTVKPEDLKVGSTQYNPKDMQITDKGLQITLSPVRYKLYKINAASTLRPSLISIL